MTLTRASSSGQEVKREFRSVRPGGNSPLPPGRLGSEAGELMYGGLWPGEIMDLAVTRIVFAGTLLTAFAPPHCFKDRSEVWSGPSAEELLDEACEEFIRAAIRSRIVVGRPWTNRVDVDEHRWRRLSNDYKRRLVVAVRCAAADGKAGDADFGVVHGFQTGDRLAIAAAGRLNVRQSASRKTASDSNSPLAVAPRARFKHAPARSA